MSPSSPSGVNSGEETACVWYVARGGKDQREGPFSLAALKEQAGSGKLAPGDLIWREGLAGWMPAQDEPGLFGPSGATSAMLRPIGQGDAPLPGWLRKVVNFLTHPMFFFLAGLAFAVAAGLAAFGSAVALVLRQRAWFDGVVWFLLLFIVCEAVCGILEILRRAEKEKRDRP